MFHRRRSPLWKWFWAAYQLAQDKKGIAALELAKQIGVSYTTAWLMLHKLRRAMRHRNAGYVLQGLVEVDECYVGGETEGIVQVGNLVYAGTKSSQCFSDQFLVRAEKESAISTSRRFHCRSCP